MTKLKTFLNLIYSAFVWLLFAIVCPREGKPEPVGSEPAKVEPVGSEPAKVEPVGSEPAKVEPVGPEPAKVEPVGPEPVGPEQPGGYVLYNLTVTQGWD